MRLPRQITLALAVIAAVLSLATAVSALEASRVWFGADGHIVLAQIRSQGIVCHVAIGAAKSSGTRGKSTGALLAA